MQLGDKSIADPRVAALFVYPREDSSSAMIGVVSGTGIQGLRATNRLPYFVSGVAYPDIMLVSADFLDRGTDALLGAGFWNSHWQLENAAFVVNDEIAGKDAGLGGDSAR